MVAPIYFNGTQLEKYALIEAINHNCGCHFGLLNMRMSTCPAHTMLITDQRALNGLLCQRRRAAELMLQEFLLPKKIKINDQLPALDQDK